ncbi:putative chitinase [Clostridium sp. ASBs410]|nr:putative chitinase [Clostridium sp. ASBs410]
MADLKDTYVVHGAWTTCTCGIRKSRIVLEKSHGIFLKNRELMTVNDCKPENIICFGGCYSMENPDTAAEAQKIQMAVEKDCPNTFTDTVMNFFTKKGQRESSDAPLRVVGICNPKIISAEWDNGGNTVEVNGEVPLLAGAKVHCLYGGEIEIIDSGQPEAGDMSQVEISPHSVPLSGSPGSNAESAAMGAAAAGIAATPGMPKQVVAGMIRASKASRYGKSKTIDVAGKSYVTASQLQAFGWKNTSDQEVANLNATLEKYGITSMDSIILFLATCGHESGKGAVALEKLNANGTTVGNYKTTERGAGYIQITWEDTHKKFLKTVNDSFSGSNTATYIAQNYPWEAAAWFWSSTEAKSTTVGSLNDYAANYASSEGVFLVTQYLVNGWPSGLTNDVAAIIRDGKVSWEIKNGRLFVDEKDVSKAPIGWDDREKNYNDAVNYFK